MRQHWTTLPPSLMTFLANKNIIKVGRAIGHDLSKIRKSHNNGVLCQGRLELAKFCVDRRVIPRVKRNGLSYISAKISGYKKPKPEEERCSAWHNDTLTQNQKNYAALDAWAGLAIYNAVKSICPVGIEVDEETQPGTFVSFMPKICRGAVAYGVVADENDTVSPSPTRVIRKGNLNILVLHVVKAKYIVKHDGNVATNNNSRSLESFGGPQFILNIPKSTIRTEKKEIITESMKHKENIKKKGQQNLSASNNCDTAAEEE